MLVVVDALVPVSPDIHEGIILTLVVCVFKRTTVGKLRVVAFIQRNAIHLGTSLVVDAYDWLHVIPNLQDMCGCLIFVAVVVACLVVKVGDVLRVVHRVIKDNSTVLAVIYIQLREVGLQCFKRLLGDEVCHYPSACQA